MVGNNNTSNQQHQKSHPWLYFPLSRIGNGHCITTEDVGGNYDIRVEVEGRPPVDSASSGGEGESEGSLRSVEVSEREKRKISRKREKEQKF